MKDEIKEILEIQEDSDYKKLSIEDILLLKECITNLQEILKEYEQIGIMQFNRPYAKRYLKECKKENPKLLYPDTEDIYKKYYNLKEKNKRLEQEIEELRETTDRLTNKEYKKDDSHLGIVRTKEQLERIQNLLCFKSKVEITDILIDTEEKIDKAIEYIKLWHYRNDFRVNSFTTGVKEELLEILQGSDKEC